MTSRFVSGGTIVGDGAEAETGTESRDLLRPLARGDNQARTWNTPEAVAGAGGGGGSGGGTTVEWETVQKDLEEDRRRRVEARKAAVEGGAGGGERSLYEILQANKAAKQAAFEEQNRIRNQFRALDDDEIEFLHGVSDEKRAEEERVRRETEEGLASFRKAQQSAGGSGGDDTGRADDDGSGDAVVEEWGAVAGRKRKREKEKAGLKGVRRRTSVPDDKGEREKVGQPGAAKGAGEVQDKDDAVPSAAHAERVQGKLTPTKPMATPVGSGSTTAQDVSAPAPTPAVNATSTSKPALGLVDYGSDEDDDD